MRKWSLFMIIFLGLTLIIIPFISAYFIVQIDEGDLEWTRKNPYYTKTNTLSGRIYIKTNQPEADCRYDCTFVLDSSAESDVKQNIFPDTLTIFEVRDVSMNDKGSEYVDGIVVICERVTNFNSPWCILPKAGGYNPEKPIPTPKIKI